MRKKWGVAAAVLAAVLLQLLYLNWTCDDSFISFRYADNLARGEGPVFNVGEHVEGYSNFLWVLFLTGGRLTGLSPLLVSKGLGILAAILSLFLLFKVTALWHLDPVLRQGAVFLLGITVGFAYFSVSGMETVFYAALLLAAVFLQKLFERNSKPPFLFFLYIILFLISVTRPEGILFFGLTVLFHWILYFSKRSLHRWWVLLVPQLFLGASYGLFLFWRWSTFGALFPNTYYAKPPGTFVSYESTALVGNLISGLPSGSFLLLLLPFLLVNKKQRAKLYLSSDHHFGSACFYLLWWRLDGFRAFFFSCFAACSACRHGGSGLFERWEKKNPPVVSGGRIVDRSLLCLLERDGRCKKFRPCRYVSLFCYEVNSPSKSGTAVKKPVFFRYCDLYPAAGRCSLYLWIHFHRHPRLDR